MSNIMNWNELWREKRSRTPWGLPLGSGFEFWDQRARQLDTQRKWNQEITTRIITWLDLDPGCTVLDVGAGTGALCVPLSKVARHITAVEPSEEMRVFMGKYAQEEGATNICCIGKPWEEVKPFEDVDQHDVVVASHSLVMEDLKAALAKMDQLANRSVHLITSVDDEHGSYQELRKSLHCGEDRGGLDYIYPYNILYEMGIYADVEIWDVEYRRSFASLDNAVKLWASNLGALSPTDDEVIRSYLSRRIVEEDGSYLLNSRDKWALISWTP